ncbi:MAG: FliA/WhiG family RNA polymerase sigma factor [Acidobacteria bacterium]|nr:FliA/WhiG family RNA polymerase sigma factor [Acidobacteriota bacterium]
MQEYLPEPAALKSDLREHMILENLPQIKYIAQRIAAKLPPNVEMDDLISAGILGLLDAVDKFDPLRGVKFKTYADRRIKGAILDSLRNLDWAPRSLRKKGKDLEKAYRELDQTFGRAARDHEVARHLGIDEEELHKLLNQLRGIKLGSFQDLSACAGGPGGGPIRHLTKDTNQDPFYVCQRREIHDLLSEAIDKLPDSERLVVSLYYFDELTMREVGEVLGVNESRVSQLHTKAMLRLRGKLQLITEEGVSAKK